VIVLPILLVIMTVIAAVIMVGAGAAGTTLNGR
jgi:hypothetical protein